MSYLLFEEDEYLQFQNIPEWSKDNKFIEKYYRKDNKNWSYYIKSLFKWHNETINIWSHLLGFLGILGISVYVNITKYFDIDKYITQDICFNLFTSSMMICFLFSSIMHLLYPKNEKICERTQFLDYLGINVLIASTFSTFVYYAFYCQRNIQIIYYIIILSLSFIVLPISKMKIFMIYKYRFIRPTVFLLYACSILVPVIHRSTYKEINDKQFFTELEIFSISALMYIIGIILYITRFPESYWSGKFDIIGSSHQLFHIFVLLGGLTSLYAVLKTMYSDNKLIC